MTKQKCRCENCDRPCRRPDERWADLVARIEAREPEWYPQTFEMVMENGQTWDRLELVKDFYLKSIPHPTGAGRLMVCSRCKELGVDVGELERSHQARLEAMGQLTIFDAIGHG
ncbi:hypothetical protein [Prochlorothrix hollandica]|uniref:hypothetical protein n=1 Tax=Prochlorothrix hollandica TaxID=1223 RepID=UPI00037CF550|nr:hypothetical protein [Prochlorothrix hollandica]